MGTPWKTSVEAEGGEEMGTEVRVMDKDYRVFWALLVLDCKLGVLLLLDFCLLRWRKRVAVKEIQKSLEGHLKCSLPLHEIHSLCRSGRERGLLILAKIQELVKTGTVGKAIMEEDYSNMKRRLMEKFEVDFSSHAISFEAMDSYLASIESLIDINIRSGAKEDLYQEGRSSFRAEILDQRTGSNEHSARLQTRGPTRCHLRQSMRYIHSPLIKTQFNSINQF